MNSNASRSRGLVEIRQECRRKSYSGNLSLPLNQNSPLTVRRLCFDNEYYLYLEKYDLSA